MCNIAGYVGTRQAAPILIEMMRKQEGMNAGYYTGIATLHEGKIYYRKAVGDLRHLLDTTDAASLPGTVGILHGRTPGDGDAEWGHPFLGERDGVPVTAFVLNGTSGIFRNDERHIATVEKLASAGYHFRTRTAAELVKEKAPLQPDGTRVHPSEVMSNLILYHMDRGMEPALAMETAMAEYPKEAVELLLSVAHPDRITYCRFNFPMNVGFAPHGAYLASAALAFPDDAREPLPLPMGSSGTVWKDRYEAIPYRALPATPALIDTRVRQEGYQIVCAALREGKHTFPELCKKIEPVFAPADCVQRAMLTYEILTTLYKDGRLQWDTERVPGVLPDRTAPVFRLFLRNNLNS